MTTSTLLMSQPRVVWGSFEETTPELLDESFLAARVFLDEVPSLVLVCYLVYSSLDPVEPMVPQESPIRAGLLRSSTEPIPTPCTSPSLIGLCTYRL